MHSRWLVEVQLKAMISFEKLFKPYKLNNIMVLNFDKKVNFVKSQIEEEFNSLDEVQLENSFEKYKQDKRTYTFIDYYNRIVLDKENIDFGEFKRQWAIQGMTREVFNFFTENFEKLKKEIETEKDIKKFFKKYCCKVRKEASFCSKLFHTILPNEFQPVDNPIKKRFNLQ